MTPFRKYKLVHSRSLAKRSEFALRVKLLILLGLLAILGCKNTEIKDQTGEGKLDDQLAKRLKTEVQTRVRESDKTSGVVVDDERAEPLSERASEQNEGPEEHSPKESTISQTYISEACGMKFVRIEAGTFTMGSPAGAFPSSEWETEHEVEITRPFYMGTYEVTREEWVEVMRFKPWDLNKPSWLVKAQEVEDQSRWPATDIQWAFAQLFLQKLSKLDGRQYRLPSEAEWEYVCRAGTNTHFFCGNVDKDLYEYGWMRGNSEAQKTDAGDFGNRVHSVGLLKPNPWGVYDLCGNVREWCEDWYDRDYYQRSPVNDPVNLEETSQKVLRGGNVYYDPVGCRSAVRGSMRPDSEHLDTVGFRVVCEIE